MNFNSRMVNLGTVRFKGRCSRHPGFDPNDGPGGVRGGCKRCELLLEIFQTHARLVELMVRAKNEVAPPPVKAAAASADDERQIALF